MNENNEAIKKAEKFYMQDWFMWIMLIFISPVGIFLMWKFHNELKKNTKIIISIIFGLFFVIAAFGSNNKGTALSDTTQDNANINNNSSEISPNTSSEKTNVIEKNKKYGLGDTFAFDGLELTLDSNYSFVTLENMFSEKNGSTVIKLGVTVKNISSETKSLNMFYYSFFGSQGIELEGVSSYFDEAVDDGGDLRPDASYKKYFYILYDGNGKYGIDFDNYSQKVAVEFDITK